MRKRMMQRLAAAAAVVLAVMPLPGYTPMESGDEGAVVAARRAQAPQIEKNDVVLDETRAQQSRTQAHDPLRKDHGVRKAVNQPGFRVALRDARFGEAMASSSSSPCPKWICGANSPVVDGAEIVTQPVQVRQARRHQAQQLTEKDVAVNDTPAQQPLKKRAVDSLRSAETMRKALTRPGLNAAAQGARFGEAFGLNLNSPIVDGAEIVAQSDQVHPARRHQAQQLTEKDVAVNATPAQPSLQNRAFDRLQNADDMRKALTRPGLNAAAQGARFGEAFGLNLNSPIVDGAEIVAQPVQVHPARRHQSQQLTDKDVTVNDAPAQQPLQKRKVYSLRSAEPIRKALTRPGLNAAAQGARFGEAFGLNLNSPIVDGAEIVEQPDQVHPARRHQVQQLTGKDVVLDGTSAQPSLQKRKFDSRNPEHMRKALTRSGLNAAAQCARFGEAFGQNLNSPVVDGADIVAQSDQVHPARRHQVQQLTGKDVVLDGTSAQQPLQKRKFDSRNPEHMRKALTRSGLNAAAQSARFGESFGVNLNSPIVDAMAPTSGAFHELNLAGAPNAAGFAIAGVRNGDTAYDLEVTGASVTAHPRGRTAPRLTGAALAGLVLDLRDARGARYALQVASSGTTTYWVGARDLVPTYTLTYTSTAQPVPQPLCTAGVNEAILFTGDRYDAARKTVTATGAAARGWVNIACARTALAKLFLVRHTEASQAVPTTPAERQAMFKMFTGDYCGDGTPFTVHGQPLLWADAKAITKFAATPASFEAIWNENGAVCLDQPRRPELATAMTAHCRPLPRCTPQAAGYVMSANPR